MAGSLVRYLGSRKAAIAPSSDHGAASASGPRIVSVDTFLRRPDGSFPAITPCVLTKARLEAFGSYAEKLSHPSITQGIVVMGLPCSGKSRLVAQLTERYPTSVFFDATLSTHQERLTLIEAARAAGKPIHCIRVHEAHSTVMSRNRQRHGTRRLPDDAMLAMIQRMSREPPSVAEGFASVTAYGPTLRLEQTIKKLDHVFTGFDVTNMTYVSAADAPIPDARNPIPMLGALFTRCPGARVGILHGSFDYCHDGHLAMMLNAIAAKKADGSPILDLLVVEPVLDNPEKPWLKENFAYRVALLRRAIANEPRVARRVVVTDVQGRVPGFPSHPIPAMERLLSVYDPQCVPGRFAFVQSADTVRNGRWRHFGPQSSRPHVGLIVTGRPGYELPDPSIVTCFATDGGAPVDISSTEIRAALQAGDLSAIADRVPASTLAALKGELAARQVPSLWLTKAARDGSPT